MRVLGPFRLLSYNYLKFNARVGHGSRMSTSSRVEHVLEVGGTKINYLKTGQGPNIVMCLPGALGTIWSDFKPQIEGFDPEKFTLVAWDPPGYGKSRPPDKKFDAQFYETDAKLASQFMQMLGFQRYSLMGWSDGGITSLVMASSGRSPVDKLVVWGANAYVTPKDLKLYEAIRDVSKWSAKMREPLEATYGAAELQWMMSSWYGAIQTILEERKGEICGTSRLASIRSPSLVVHGELDPLVPREHPDHLIKYMPSAKLYTFKKGKHNLHLRYSGEFNTVVQNFLLDPDSLPQSKM